MNNKIYKKYLLVLTTLVILSGCVSRSADGSPTGFIWDLFGKPAETAILWFAQLFGNHIGSYGLGIIIVTFIIRLVIAPLNMGMSKSSIESSEKMAYIKPQMDNILQRLKQATSFEEKSMIQQEQMALQQAAGIKIVSVSGCLPLLIQIPLFSGLYFATITSSLINTDIFLGIPLGQPSVLFAILSAILYFIQGLLSQIGMSEEQKRINRSVLIITPIMQIIFGMQVPAGASLYFVVGGIVVCITTMYTSYILRPRIKKQVQSDMKTNDTLKTYLQQLSQRKDVTPQKSQSAQTTSVVPSQRNAGKQNRK